MTAPLGPLLVLTDRTQCQQPLLDVLAAAVDGGARTVVLREKDLPPAERRALAEAVARLLEPVGGQLVVAGRGLGQVSGAIAQTYDVGAVHLSARDPLPDPRPRLVGRSCHDAASAAAARTQGCDWVTLSPVQPTSSKPGYGPALGLAGLAAVVPVAPPVYALGGLGPEHVVSCLQAGAVGLAVMGAVMRSPHPDRTVASLLARLPQESPR